jgi:WD40 repeat protein
MVAVGTVTSAVKIWSGVDGRLLHEWTRETPPAAKRSPGVTTLAFTPDSRRLAAGGGDGLIVLVDAERGRPEGRLVGHTDPVQAIAFDRSQDRLASVSGGGFDFSMRLWAAQTGLQTSRTPLAGMGKAIALAPAGDLVAVGSWDQVDIYTLPALEKIGSVMAGNRHQPVEDIRVSEDGTVVAISGGDGKLHGWSTRTRREVWTIASQGRLRSADLVRC